MSDPVGLSIGMTNLVAARVGNAPVTRRAVLTLFPDRAPVVGVTDQADHGVVMGGFVERVGDPIPLVAADGSKYHAARLMVEALAAMVDTVSGAAPPSEIVIAVPTYWGPAAVAALRDEVASAPSLAPNNVPARMFRTHTRLLPRCRSAPACRRRVWWRCSTSARTVRA